MPTIDPERSEWLILWKRRDLWVHIAPCEMYSLTANRFKASVVTARLSPYPTGVCCGHQFPTSARLWRTPTTHAARCRTVTPRSPPLNHSPPFHHSHRQPGSHLWGLMGPPLLPLWCWLPFLPEVCTCRGFGWGGGGGMVEEGVLNWMCFLINIVDDRLFLIRKTVQFRSVLWPIGSWGRGGHAGHFSRLQRSSFSLFCGGPSLAVLAWAGTSILWHCPSSRF